MYTLITAYDYPDQLWLVAEDRGVLEEIALSLFEEDWYEWFCIVAIDESDMPLDRIIKIAKHHAMNDSKMVKVVEAIFIT